MVSPGAWLLEAAMEDSSVEAVWKMYSAARASLPYKERMDNLTWRMLGMRMKRIQERLRSEEEEADVEMQEQEQEQEQAVVEGDEAYDDLRFSVNPMNTVLLTTPEAAAEPLQTHYGSFSSHVQATGFLTSADLHNQFNLFDTGFGEQMDDQLIMDFSKSSPAIASETSDSNVRDRLSMINSDVLAGQSAGSVFRDSSAVTPTMPDHANFLDHFFPTSEIGGGASTVPPVAPATATTTTTASSKAKKLRPQNSTATQARRGSGVKKRPIPLRNASTTSLTSLSNESTATSEPSKDAKDSSKDTRCSNCHTKTTPLWRRDPVGNPLCNACGLFLKLHGVVRPLSLKTDVIKKRQRNSNTSKQSKSSSPNLEDSRQTRKTVTSLGSRKRSTTNVRDVSSSSPVGLVNSLSRVGSNVETGETPRRLIRTADVLKSEYSDESHNFTDDRTNSNNNDTNNNTSDHFDFLQATDLPMGEETNASSRPTNSEHATNEDGSCSQQNSAAGSTNWEWLSLSL